MQNIIKKIIRWALKSEIDVLESKIKEANSIISDYKIESKKMENTRKHIQKMFDGLDVSVDVHECAYSPSWAVISIQGEKTDYIKFVDLGHKDVLEISRFLRQFDRNIKIDASPRASGFLRINK